MFNFFIYICIYLFLPILIQKRCSILQIKLNLVPFTIDHWFLFVITSYQFLVHHSRMIPRNRVNGILLEWFKHVPFFVLIIRKFAQMLKLVDYILHSVLCIAPSPGRTRGDWNILRDFILERYLIYRPDEVVLHFHGQDQRLTRSNGYIL